MSNYNEYIFDITHLIDTLYQKRQNIVHLQHVLAQYKRVMPKSDMYRFKWLERSCVHTIEDIDAVFDTLVIAKSFAEIRHLMRRRKYMK